MTVEEVRKKPEETISEAEAEWWKNVGKAQKEFRNTPEQGNGNGNGKTKGESIQQPTIAEILGTTSDR